MIDVVEVPWAPYIALISGFFAVAAWTLLLARSVWAYRMAAERRWAWLVMPLVGLLASLGTLAAAFGFAASRGIIGPLWLDPTTLSFISSIGRGALAAGGLIALLMYRPRHK